MRRAKSVSRIVLACMSACILSDFLTSLGLDRIGPAELEHGAAIVDFSQPVSVFDEKRLGAERKRSTGDVVFSSVGCPLVVVHSNFVDFTLIW